MDIINPSTNRVILTITEDDEEKALKKVKRLKERKRHWEEFGILKRIEIIKNFSELLKKNKLNLAQDLTQEMGKPLSQSVSEIEGACFRIKYFVEHSFKVLREEQIKKNGSIKESLSYEPLGCIANISAWNYPFLIGVNVFIPALICGNTVAYKPSHITTITGLNIAKLIHQAGVPEYAFQIFLGRKKISKFLLDSKLDGYFFTGSYEVGKQINEQLSSKLVPVNLELGGKDPCYITEYNNNIKEVANAVADAKFYNNGQSCCAVERIYVHQKNYEEFLNNFVNKVKNFCIGNPFENETTNGPIAQKEQMKFLKYQVSEAVEKGAKLLLGGKTIDRKGNFFEPTILVDVDHSMQIMTEETFGPVVGIQKVSSDEEALHLMNDSKYGLSASVFTTNSVQAKKLMKNIDSGNVYMNCADRVSPFLPWAGRKSSGVGVTLSKHGIYSFCKTKGWHFNLN